MNIVNGLGNLFGTAGTPPTQCTSTLFNEQLGAQQGNAYAQQGIIDPAAYWSAMAQQQKTTTGWRHVETSQDLDHAVFKTPIETLINLWIAKYGPDWVAKDDVTSDTYFSWVGMRLKSCGKIEEHQVMDAPPPAHPGTVSLGGGQPLRFPKAVVRVISE